MFEEKNKGMTSKTAKAVLRSPVELEDVGLSDKRGSSHQVKDERLMAASQQRRKSAPCKGAGSSLSIKYRGY